MNDTLTTPTHAELVAKLTDPGNIGEMKDRTIFHSIDLHTVDATTTCLRLVVTHSKERKEFMGQLMIVGLEDRGNGFIVTFSRPFERHLSKRMPPAPVMRYSATSLMAYRSLCMEELRQDPSWLDGLDLGPWSAQH